MQTDKTFVTKITQRESFKKEKKKKDKEEIERLITLAFFFFHVK